MALASYLTNAGLVVLNKVLASGGPLNFTRAELGSGVETSEANCRARTSLKNKIADASLVSVAYEGGEAKISVQYVNTGLATGFFVNEVGIYAKDPTTHADVLYCYATFGDTPDWIAPASSAQYIRTYDIITIISSVQTVTVEVAPSTLATYEQLKDVSDRVDAIAKGAKIYGMRWNKANAQGTRLFDAAGLPTDVTPFCYRGEVAALSNPFDSLYPWSEFKQCNVDLTALAGLAAGQDIRDAVVAWYGDVGFKDDGSNGFVGAYRPEYWFTAYEDGDSIVFAVSDHELPGWAHCKPYIRGYGHCVDVGDSKVSCYKAQPLSNTALSTIHTYAGNNGMTLDDIYTYSAELTALVVEYATLNTQAAIGNGVDSLYYAPDLHPYADTSSSNKVILPKSYADYCIPGATIDFATTKDGVVLADRRSVVSCEEYSGDADYVEVTFDGTALSLTAASVFVSIHGLDNGPALGNASGYVGTAGKCNSFYRGAALFGNKWRYILGAYRQTGTQHIWICPEGEDPDDYDALNTAKHIDTGLVLPTGEGYIKRLGIVPGLGAVPFCLEKGGTAGSANPVGDYFYGSTSGSNTILLVGGAADHGARDGAFFGGWSVTASNSYWTSSAAPVLKHS